MNRQMRREWRRDIKRRQAKTKGTKIDMLAREKWQIATLSVLEDVFEERKRQVAQYGHNEDVYDGTGPDVRWLLPYTSDSAEVLESVLREDYEGYTEVADNGLPTWLHLVREELAEAAKEDDAEKLAEELTQVAALCVSWVEKIKVRGLKPVPVDVR